MSGRFPLRLFIQPHAGGYTVTLSNLGFDLDTKRSYASANRHFTGQFFSTDKRVLKAMHYLDLFLRDHLQIKQ